MFQKKPNPLHKEWLRKMDTVITGLILWGVVASIYGIAKKKSHEHEKISGRKRKAIFKALKIFIFGLPKKEESKPGFFKKLLKKR